MQRVSTDPPDISRARAKAIARQRLAEMTNAEDARLTEAALADPDNPPVDHSKRRPGRPPAASTKQSVSLRLDRDIVAAYRKSGDGWQTRMNDDLRKAVGLS